MVEIESFGRGLNFSLMPELPYRNTPFIDRVKSERAEKLRTENVRHVKSSRLRELSDEFHERILGGGEECFVMPKKGNETKVVAANYEEIERRRGLRLFYVHKIFSILFPHNFPQVYAVFFGENSGTVRQFVQGVKRQTVAEDDIRYSLRHASELWERLFGEKIALDPNTANILLTEAWEQFYVDRMLLTYTFWTLERKAILLKHMQGSTYSQDEIDSVMQAVNRFDALNSTETL